MINEQISEINILINSANSYSLIYPKLYHKYQNRVH